MTLQHGDVSGTKCHIHRLAAMRPQPEQPADGVFGQCCACAVLVQEHHALRITRDGRQQGGLLLPEPFIEHG